jgi:hypothetical protein
LKIASKDVATNSEICLEERIFLQQLASFKARLATTSEFASWLPRINFQNWICLEECLYNIEKIAWCQRISTTSRVASRIMPTTNSKIAWASKHDLSITWEIASKDLATTSTFAWLLTISQQVLKFALAWNNVSTTSKKRFGLEGSTTSKTTWVKDLWKLQI